MPLPIKDTAWPPQPWDYAYRVWAENDAWYVGDTEALKNLYMPNSVSKPTHSVNGQPYRGGIVGNMRRWFWGTPTPANESRTRLHISAPADVAQMSADLLFAEPPKFTLEGAQAAKDRLDLIANRPDFQAMLPQAGEHASAFGAAALVTSWDTSISDTVFLREAAADVIVPEFRLGQLSALTLWTQYVDGSIVYRHLERHEPGAIFHALYQGSMNGLGRQVPLQDRPETAPLAELVNSDGFIPTGITRLTASLMLNLPAKAWRKKGDLSLIGRSDFTADVKGLFDSLDAAWSSWMRDLELGRARLVVPQAMLENTGPGRGAYFDVDRELFTPVQAPGMVNGSSIEQVQFNIRVQEHRDTCDALYERILVAAGLKDADPDPMRSSARTATEVNDANRASERTRQKKLVYARQALAEQVSVALEIDGLVFPGKGGGKFPEPTVEFVERSQIDPEKLSRTIQAFRAATVLSIETGVRMAQPDLDDAEVDAEVERIKAEQGVSVPDPAQLDRSNPSVADLAAAADRLTN